MNKDKKASNSSLSESIMKTAINMSKETFTPLTDYLNMSFIDFRYIIKCLNDTNKEKKEAYEKLKTNHSKNEVNDYINGLLKGGG